MLFIFEYIYDFFNYIKENYYYYSKKDDLIPTKKEQEFINFNIYSKTIIIDNDNDNDNDNLNTNLI